MSTVVEKPASPCPVKHVEAARRQLIEEFVKQQFGMRAKCPHCGVRVRILKQEYNARLLLFGAIHSVEQIVQETKHKMQHK